MYPLLYTFLLNFDMNLRYNLNEFLTLQSNQFYIPKAKAMKRITYNLTRRRAMKGFKYRATPRANRCAI